MFPGAQVIEPHNELLARRIDNAIRGFERGPGPGIYRVLATAYWGRRIHCFEFEFDFNSGGLLRGSLSVTTCGMLPIRAGELTSSAFRKSPGGRFIASY